MPDGWSGLTDADQAIIREAVMLIFPNPPPISGFPGSSNGNIKFQFPPRITSDGKETDWTIIKSINWEPIVRFNGSSARKITLEATYIVTSKSGGWTVQAIDDTLKTYKAYFYHTMGQAVTNMPLVQLKIYQHAPDPNIFWRSGNVSITHDGALMRDSGGKVLPLISKVTMDLEMVTKVGIAGRRHHEMQAPVRDTPLAQWY